MSAAWVVNAGAVELRNEVARAMGLDLPGTLVFDYPTTAAIAAYITSKLAAAAALAAPPTSSADTAEHGRFHLQQGHMAHAGGVGLVSGLPAPSAATVRPAVVLEAVRGRLSGTPGAETHAGDPLAGGLAELAEPRRDAVCRVPLDRWDADQLLAFGASPCFMLVPRSASTCSLASMRQTVSSAGKTSTEIFTRE